MSFLDKIFKLDDPLADVAPMKAVSYFPTSGNQGYRTSRSNLNTLKAWHTSPNSPNADMYGKRSTAIGDSNDLAMNSPLAQALVGRLTTSVLGPGLLPQSTPDWEFLGISREAAKDWSNNAERRFDVWAKNPRCDDTGQRNFYELQQSVFKAAMNGGDVFIAFPWKKKKKAGRWNWRTGVRVIEGALVRTPNDPAKTRGKDIVDGMEYENGSLVAIWVAAEYEGSNDEHVLRTPTNGRNTFTRIPIYSKSGRRNVHHLMLPGGRPGQRRSMPFLTPVVEMLKTVTRHTDAELQSAVVASMFTVFVRDASGNGMGLNEDFYPGMGTAGIPGGGGTYVDEDGEQEQVAKDEGYGLEYGMGPANIVELEDGKDISIAEPRKANGMYAAFHKAIVNEICSALGLPYEQVLMLFDSSYTASKAALQEGIKTYKTYRLWFVRNFVAHAWEAFLEEEVITRRISADGFLDDEVKRAAWARAYWVGPANGQIDPFKEAKASVTKIQNKLTTYATEMMESTGERWDQAMYKHREELDLLEDLDMAPIPVTEDIEEVVGPTGKDPIKPGGQSWGAQSNEEEETL